MTNRAYFRGFAATALLCASVACGTEETTNPQPSPTPTPSPSPTKNIVATAQADAQFSTLVTAIQAATLAQALSEPGPFTVFAPTNAAFSALPAGTLDNLLKPENKAQLEAILKYHVVSGKLLAADVTTRPDATTLQGAKVTFTKNGTEVRVNDAKITATDVLTTNGVIHVIDKVLLPPAPAPDKDIVELAQATPELSTLVTAVTTAELAATLKGAGPFTVFAPTNAAFSNLPAGVLTALLADKPRLANILTYHVVAGKKPASEVAAATTFTAVNGDSLPITVNGTQVRIGGALITMTDIQASNGVIHLIDAVLVPNSDKTVVELAQATPSLSTLVTAVTTAELAATLSGPGPFTVFAPTNSAFEALPAGVLAALLADKPRLANVLTYHVVGQRLLAADVIAQTSFTAVNGDAIPVRVNGTQVRIGGALVTMTDIKARNGVVHVIDAVILPNREKSVVAVASDTPGFTTLVAAINAAQLGTALSGDGPFTVFAPTDAAFAALPQGTLANLLLPANQARLQAILQYHVVSGSLEAAQVVAQSSLTSLSGIGIPVTVTGTTVRVGGARVTTTNIRAANGIIHVIDAVLLPPTVVGIAQSNPDFTTLVTAVVAAGLADDLSADGPFTVFAPRNAAFAALPAGVLNNLLLPANQAQLIAILQLHVVPGTLLAADVLGRANVTTLGGVTLPVTNVNNQPRIGGARIVATDIRAGNGVVHVLDDVILPAN